MTFPTFTTIEILSLAFKIARHVCSHPLYLPFNPSKPSKITINFHGHIESTIRHYFNLTVRITITMHQLKETAHVISKAVSQPVTAQTTLANTPTIVTFFPLLPPSIKFPLAYCSCYLNHSVMTNSSVSKADFQFSSSPTNQIITNVQSPSTPDANYHQNPRKKRSKLIKIDAATPIAACTISGFIIKPKYAKKPDPSAPKITRPCSECGKKFWSWKALFGHMRCHPERQWRGINPPPQFCRPVSPVKELNYVDRIMTEEDHEVAACLLMLANGIGCARSEDDRHGITTSQLQVVQDIDVHARMNCRFECTSCKKMFGSHQALSGHRASHKNVKGCFAITRSANVTCEIIDQDRRSDGTVKENVVEDDKKMVMYLGHKCSICLRVFSSGQALGGHKRCHWEKGDEPYLNQGLSPFAAEKDGCDLDLNLPAPVEDYYSASSSYSSGLTLDLRLGL